MNRYETWFCGTRLWRWVTRRQVLPWMLQGSELGDHVLELGAGPGAATEELGRLASRVTSLECDHAFAAKLGARLHHAEDGIARDDANNLRRAFLRAAHHGHLVHVRAQEPFQQTQEWFFRRRPQNFLPRDHGGLDGVVGPLVARNRVEGVDIHHPDEAVVVDHQVAAAAGA